jgi:hypothetical protein
MPTGLLAKGPGATEAGRLVMQRVGQDIAVLWTNIGRPNGLWRALRIGAVMFLRVLFIHAAQQDDIIARSLGLFFCTFRRANIKM